MNQSASCITAEVFVGVYPRGAFSRSSYFAAYNFCAPLFPPISSSATHLS